MVRCLRLGLVTLTAVAVTWAGDPPAETAAALAKKAGRALKAGDAGQAYVLYSQASAIQPKNRTYRVRAAALQSSAGGSGGTASISAAGHPALPPDILFDSVTAREMAGHPALASPPMLVATAGAVDFDLSGNARELFAKVAARFGLTPVFDDEYPQGGAQIRFRQTGVDYRGALKALQAATGSFIVPVDATRFLVARDTPVKRTDLEQHVVLTLRVPQSLMPAELTEIIQIVRQATGVEKVGFDNAKSVLVIQDRVSKATAAQELLAQLTSYHPEVMIDFELLQVSDSDVINYGMLTTNAFPLVYLGGIQNSVATIPAGVANLLTFGGGRTLIGVGSAAMQSLFNEMFSSGRSAFSAQIRAGNGQVATFHSGERYPIITQGFIGVAAGTSGPTFTAPPAVNWENLGLDMKATPRIHGADEVSLTLEASYETLTGDSADGIPVISRQKLSGNIRVRDGEWTLIAGLTQDSKSKSGSGTPGLGKIPLLGSLFRRTSIDNESSSVLIGIRPHILSLGPEETVTTALGIGSETRPYLPL